jgi:magnesium chelatase family protein
MNPCPCGNWGNPRAACRCKKESRLRYLAKISGPLLDRIDLLATVAAVPWRDLDRPSSGADTATVLARVLSARELQRMRGAATNAEIPDRGIDRLVEATPDARALLGRAVDSLHLSARAARRVLRVARTIADLAGGKRVGPSAIAEALVYRDERGSA